MSCWTSLFGFLRQAALSRSWRPDRSRSPFLFGLLRRPAPSRSGCPGWSRAPFLFGLLCQPTPSRSRHPGRSRAPFLFVLLRRATPSRSSILVKVEFLLPGPAPLWTRGSTAAGHRHLPWAAVRAMEGRPPGHNNCPSYHLHRGEGVLRSRRRAPDRLSVASKRESQSRRFKFRGWLHPDRGAARFSKVERPEKGSGCTV